MGVDVGSPADAEADEIIARIRAARPDILFVAFGAPKQDLWIARHRAALGVPVMVGVGGAFDHIAGVRKRAPGWVQAINLEWLYRLATQPWRWRRQLALPQVCHGGAARTHSLVVHPQGRVRSAPVRA